MPTRLSPDRRRSRLDRGGERPRGDAQRRAPASGGAVEIREDEGGALHIDAPPPVTGRRGASGDVVWVSIDGDVFEVRVSQGARAVRRARSGRADAADVGDRRPGRASNPATPCASGDTARRARSDEDGAAHPRAARRHRPRGELPGGRSRAAWRGAGGARVGAHARRDGLRSRAARRAAERGGAESRRPTRSRSSIAERRGPAGHRSVGVRQPEVGAADGGRGRGVRRHRAAARHALLRRWCRTCRASIARSPPASTEVAIFAAASETFSRRNINQSIDESFATYGGVARAAAAAGLRVRGYLSTAFGCPFEGDVPIARVVDLTSRLLDLGVFEVAVSDTIGIAHPGQVRRCSRH